MTLQHSDVTVWILSQKEMLSSKPGGDWVGLQPAQAPLCCAKCNKQPTHQWPVYQSPYCCIMVHCYYWWIGSVDALLSDNELEVIHLWCRSVFMMLYVYLIFLVPYLTVTFRAEHSGIGCLPVDQVYIHDWLHLQFLMLESIVLQCCLTVGWSSDP